MKTTIFKSDLISNDELNLICSFLEMGAVFAFPTETVYGIGCDLFSEIGAKRIYELKDRHYNLPLSAYVSSIEMALTIVKDTPDDFFLLAENFLPGPLTIILNKNQSVPDFVNGGLETIGIRFSDHEITRRIIQTFGKPLSGTSANISGSSPAIDCPDVLREFSEAIPLIIDGGKTKFAQESTVLSLAGVKPFVIREGVIKIKNLEDVLNINLSD
ncbi:MAG: L-threonylcarbamoyladenylate synthase [Bacteroidota bacterium]